MTEKERGHELGLEERGSEDDAEVGGRHLVEAVVGGHATQVAHDVSERRQHRLHQRLHDLRDDRDCLLLAQVLRRLVLKDKQARKNEKPKIPTCQRRLHSL